jgi:alkaline phosphatase
MATGESVNNGVVSVALPGDGSELETVLELHKDRDQSTGLITIYDSIVDATPAGFGAHTSDRGNKPDIASDLWGDSQPNILFGHADYYVVPSHFTAVGYTHVSSAAQLFALSGDSVQSVLGVFSDTSPTLPERTEVALDILEEDAEGFFLMVEQANIDKAGHSNNLAAVVAAVVEFEAAVEVALAWAAGRDDTLVIVTADHECGGLICDIDDCEAADEGVVPSAYCSFTDTQHTGVKVPVYAIGLGAEDVAGTIDNTDIYALTAGFGL